MTGRVANLDLLRAVAVTLVVASNAAVEMVVGPGLAGRVASSGWVGVDLFFVLSGWLVGGLYWRELARDGRVRTGRFWGRRWLRTVPAYLVALHVVFAAKWALSGGALAYDARYLLFVQNYEARIPYWAVSWSLCVEEHFYLALPLALGAAVRTRFGMDALLAVALVVSVVSRVLTVEPGDPLYGLHYTATHMRMEGLVLGVWASHVYHRRPARWPAVVRVARLAAVPGLLLVASVPLLPPGVLNRYAFTLVDIAFAAVLVAVVARPPLLGATSRAVRAVALASYSVYMTHTVALEVTERVASGLPAPLHVAVGLAAVAAVGAAFYAAVERPSLRLRERLLPGRVPSVSLAPISLSP